ncbi:MAG: U32 family peptidase, partial [Clostridia bacterium]|nr:U32 family peptidase [Clostridia bacterium]
MNKCLPELLCPAGSPEALDAAIEGGADAVYLGGSAFNARMNAHNFGGDALRSAVLRAHAYGVKIYLTLNTLVTDKELSAFVDAARKAAEIGVDALIVADFGGAAAIHRAIPSLELHASTQMSGHNAQMAHQLKNLGFTRMVIARESPAKDLAATINESPLEIEMFIHGALCVSHSGQCLFSSLVGGRSGNRGECAQPCRLPYSCTTCNKKCNPYPLSLKDLSLAAHVPTLIESGVASLKIEGRMKSPEYVRDTARIWRTLLDERRAATPDEMRALADAFSRSGFTDGYFRETIDRKMLGIRSDSDKAQSRAADPFRGITKKIPLRFSATLSAQNPMTLTVSDGHRTVTVAGDVPEIAVNAPLSRETVERNLTKLGGTPYVIERFSAELEDGLMLPLSRLNDLRRRAIAAWEEGTLTSTTHEILPYGTQKPIQTRGTYRTARFYTPEQITSAARAFFDRIYLPLGKECDGTDGIVLPPVIFERDLSTVRGMLDTAKHAGITHALVGNLGHLSLVRDVGLIPEGDFRLNVTNSETVRSLENLEIHSTILSPELTLPQARDVGGDTSLIVYGRIPLMTLEKCVIKEIADCNACAQNRVTMRDRRGIDFPVLREWEHRNIIYNSLPTSMSDRQSELARMRITAQHFLFSIESSNEV